MGQRGKVVPRGAKGLLKAKDLEAVGAAPYPDSPSEAWIGILLLC